MKYISKRGVLMVRPQKECRIEQIPPYEKYKPAGIPMREIDLVILTMEEAEAIRLADMEELDQAAAAEQMEISRPTFHRIVSRAHSKIANALWMGKGIQFEGGNFRISGKKSQQRLFVCMSCGYEFSEPYGTGRCGEDLKCENCKSDFVKRTK